MNRLLSFLILISAFSFAACENRILSSLITGNYLGNNGAEQQNDYPAIENVADNSQTETPPTQNPPIDNSPGGAEWERTWGGINNFEREIVETINLARSDPESYMRRHYPNIRLDASDSDIDSDLWNFARYDPVPRIMIERLPESIHPLEIVNEAFKVAAYFSYKNLNNPTTMQEYINSYAKVTYLYSLSFPVSITCISRGRNSMQAAGATNVKDAEAVIHEWMKDEGMRNYLMNTNRNYIGVGWRGNRLSTIMAENKVN